MPSTPYRSIVCYRHSLTDSTQDKSGSFHSNLASVRDFGESDFRLSGEQVESRKPFMQFNVRTLEDSARSDGKIKIASVTAIIAAFPRRYPLTFSASWTRYTIRPKA